MCEKKAQFFRRTFPGGTVRQSATLWTHAAKTRISTEASGRPKFLIRALSRPVRLRAPGPRLGLAGLSLPRLGSTARGLSRRRCVADSGPTRALVRSVISASGSRHHRVVIGRPRGPRRDRRRELRLTELCAAQLLDVHVNWWFSFSRPKSWEYVRT